MGKIEKEVRYEIGFGVIGLMILKLVWAKLGKGFRMNFYKTKVFLKIAKGFHDARAKIDSAINLTAELMNSGQRLE